MSRRGARSVFKYVSTPRRKSDALIGRKQIGISHDVSNSKGVQEFFWGLLVRSELLEYDDREKPRCFQTHRNDPATNIKRLWNRPMLKARALYKNYSRWSGHPHNTISHLPFHRGDDLLFPHVGVGLKI